MATLDHIQELLRKSSDFYHPLLVRKKRDIQVFSGNFWTDDRIEKYDRKGRVCVTSSNYPKYQSAICSPYSKSPYFGEVVERDGEDLSELRETLSDWQNRSQIKDTVMQAVQSACVTGIGFLVLSTDDDEVSVEPVKDICSVALDPNIQETDASDAEYGATVTYIGKQKARRLYGEEVLDYRGNCRLMDIGDQFGCPEDSVPVVNFFEINEAGVVEYTKYVGDKCVIDSQDMTPLDRIPIYRVTFIEVRKEGKLDYDGIVAETYTLQCALNVALSTLVERLNRSPKATVLISTRQLDGLEEYYRTMHTKESLAIVYNSGNDDPVPQLIQEHYNTDDIRDTVAMLQNAIATTIGVPIDGINPANTDKTATEIMVQQANSESNISVLYESAQRCMRSLIKSVIGCMAYLMNIDPPSFKLINGPEIITERNRKRQDLMAIAALTSSDATKEILVKHIIGTFDEDISRPILDDVIANNPEITYMSEDDQSDFTPLAMATVKRLQSMLEQSGEQLDQANQMAEAEHDNAEQLRQQVAELQAQIYQMQQENLIAIREGDRDYQLAVAKLQQEQQKIDIDAAKTGVDLEQSKLNNEAELQKAGIELQGKMLDLEAKKAEVAERLMGK